MKVTDETIQQLAHLARLQFDGESQTRIREDLERVVGFCEQLNALDTTGVEPLIFMSDVVNNLREDVVKTDITKQEALLNAPSKDSDYFRVPKVIEKGN